MFNDKTSKIMKAFSIILIIATLFAACSSNKNEQNTTTGNSDHLNNTEKTIQDIPVDKESLQLFNNKCMICHNTGTSEETSIAPPMVSVKRRYKMSYESKEEFVKAVVDYTNNPTDEHALMVKAKEKFNIMPKFMYDKADLEKIAAFIYDNEIEQPVWFKEHFKKEHGNFKTVENIKPENPENSEILLHNKCVICHQNSSLQTKPIAPLISEFSATYKEKYKPKEEFSKAIVHFVNKPNEENALLKESIAQYNLMPQLNYSENTIKIIADYLYGSDEKNIDQQMKKITKNNTPTENTPQSVYESKCKICHNINVAQGEMLAPPMVNIQRKYKMLHKTKEEFIAAVINFTSSPTQGKAVMFGALKQFEVMPKLNYHENDLKMAAEYIYDNQFEKPAWFK